MFSGMWSELLMTSAITCYLSSVVISVLVECAFTSPVKTECGHIHTSIVSRHLATRGNNKILRTPPPHTSSSEEILPRLTRRTLAQLSSEQTNIPSSNHTYTKSTPKHIHHHYAPSVTSTHTTHIISSTAPTYAPHCRPWICGQTPPE